MTRIQIKPVIPEEAETETKPVSQHFSHHKEQAITNPPEGDTTLLVGPDVLVETGEAILELHALLDLLGDN